MCRIWFIVFVAVIVLTGQYEIEAYRIEFQAFDATEPLLRFQKPFPDSQQKGLSTDPHLETLADVMLFGLEDNGTDPCHSVMHHLAEEGSNFTHCLLNHARPFRVCEECITPYIIFTDLYENLLEDKRCSSVLLLADRMQVITAIYNVITSIWSSADCEKCYDPSSVNANTTTGEVSFNYTADTLLFQELQLNVSQCFNDNNTIDDSGENAVCKDCKYRYEDMNHKYSHLNQDSGGHICMDIVDMMNYTRLMWSTKYKCGRPRPDATVVIIISCMVAVVTILLYSSSKFIAKIRMPQIFKAKRMMTSSGRYGSMTQEVETSLPRIATSPAGTAAAEHRRSDSYRDVDGNGVHGTTAQST